MCNICEIITKVSACTALTIIRRSPHRSGEPRDIDKESDYSVKSKPDLMLVLMAVFGMGVVVTLMLPMAVSSSVAAPASELQAGVIIQD
jgi:hypothetical protein